MVRLKFIFIVFCFTHLEVLALDGDNQSSCNQPSWMIEEKYLNQPGFYIGTGQGESYSTAKSNAYAELGRNLSTMVTSTILSQNFSSDLEGRNYSESQIKEAVAVASQLTIRGATVDKNLNTCGTYFVLIKIERKVAEKQLKNQDKFMENVRLALEGKIRNLTENLSKVEHQLTKVSSSHSETLAHLNSVTSEQSKKISELETLLNTRLPTREATTSTPDEASKLNYYLDQVIIAYKRNNIEKAIYYLELASNLGDSQAIELLGITYMRRAQELTSNGKGDCYSAKLLVQKAAFLKNQDAISAIALLYLSGNSGFLRSCKFERKPYESIPGLKQLSKKGDGFASFMLCSIYSGNNVDFPSDNFKRPKEALKFCNVAMRDKDYKFQTQDLLGELYFKGKGVKKDLVKALAYLESVVTEHPDCFHPESCYLLGEAYLLGLGKGATHKNAIQLFEKSAINSWTEAKNKLRQLADSGDRLAKSTLERMEKQNRAEPYQLDYKKMSNKTLELISRGITPQANELTNEELEEFKKAGIPLQ